MIFVLELIDPQAPHAWFAFDEGDLLRKLAEAHPERLPEVHVRIAPCTPMALAAAVLRADGDAPRARLWPDESAALADFERRADPLWQGAGWRARLALRDQLVALDVLADDL